MPPTTISVNPSDSESEPAAEPGLNTLEPPLASSAIWFRAASISTSRAFAATRIQNPA
jgi:hypothetical protein